MKVAVDVCSLELLHSHDLHFSCFSSKTVATSQLSCLPLLEPHLLAEKLPHSLHHTSRSSGQTWTVQPEMYMSSSCKKLYQQSTSVREQFIGFVLFLASLVSFEISPFYVLSFSTELLIPVTQSVGACL